MAIVAPDSYTPCFIIDDLKRLCYGSNPQNVVAAAISWIIIMDREELEAVIGLSQSYS